MDFLSNFRFLEEEFPLLANIGQSAEYYLHSDPVVSLGKLRYWGEKLTEQLFQEHYLDFPYDNTFHNRLKALEFEGILPTKIKDIFFLIKQKGNMAVHKHRGSVPEAKNMLRGAFNIGIWFYSTYSEADGDISGVSFQVPPDLDVQRLLDEHEGRYQALEAKYKALLETRDTGELTTERSEEIKRRSATALRKVEMNEAQTRELIDEQLTAAGWEANTPVLNYQKHKTMPERGRKMAIAEWPVGRRWADYALFIGTTLYAIVEAKKYASDISSDLSQAKAYGRLAEEKHEVSLLGDWRGYRAPFLFSTNGRSYLEQIRTKSGIWFLDVRNERNIARPLRGWFSPDGLQQVYEQDLDAANQALEQDDLSYLQSSSGLSLRDYQIEAIRKVEEKIIHSPNTGRALLAMATGTGKTRTTMGLCYRLIKSNRFRRILFLVDRRLLAQQSFDAFQDNKIEDLNSFSEIYEVKALKELIPGLDTRLHFATVQGMVKRLFYADDNGPLLPIDSYDCIIVDEAHRGYLMDRELDEEELEFKNQLDYVSKYRMVLDYFDAFTIGLTATPALHTKDIFGAPVFIYTYREAVIDGYLIDHEPPTLIKTRLSEEGMLWEKGEKPKAYDKENNEIIELDELEDELHIEIEGFNKLVITEQFNRAVIQQLVRELDPEGEEKTLVFAARDSHADMVVDLLKEAFQDIGAGVPDDAIQKITGRSNKPQELVRRFKNEKYPNIVVTVDLLTTGIDVPSICHLVFLRRIRSRILYEQMLGRATRLCPEINKEFFKIYDAVRIYEALKDYTQMKPVALNPKTSFEQLSDEMELIKSPERTIQQVEQIIAKLQRKKRHIDQDEATVFQYNAQGQSIEAFTDMLKALQPEEAASTIQQHATLWRYLDELRPSPTHQLVSEHMDELIAIEHGYGKGQKPADYLDSFQQFIEENRNKIAALNLICTRPTALDRASLKTLKLELDQAGFNSRALNTAWKDTKNESIAADIISYIRTLALGSDLIDHETRIKRAVDQVRQLQDWNRIQQKWLDRFEKQLLKESVLQIEDLDQPPFNTDGGFKRLNKIFENQLSIVVQTINDHLYKETA